MAFIRLTHEHIAELAHYARNAYPNECCGLLVGNHSVVQQVIPMRNGAQYPTRAFAMEPLQLLKHLKQIDRSDEQLLGIYHSHPDSASIPSSIDVRDASLNYPHAIHLIISLKNPQPEAKAWLINNDAVETVEILIGNQAPVWTEQDPFTRNQEIALVITIILAMLLLLVSSISLLPAAPPLPTPLG